jgi:hypothetical protein
MNPLQLISRPLKRLHQDDQGTALTEFVICLPVFIFIFIGIADLYRVHNTTSILQISAAREMWTRALPIQKDYTNAMHMNAQLGSTRWLNTINQREGMSTINSISENATGVGLGAGGHFGESAARTVVIAPLGVNSRVPQPPGGVRATASAVVVQGSNGKTAERLVADHVGGLAMLTLGPGAGIRYGMVGSKRTQTVPFHLVKTNVPLTVGFDTIVAPFPHRNELHHGATMLAVQTVVRDPRYFRTVFGISTFSPRFNAGN